MRPRQDFQEHRPLEEQLRLREAVVGWEPHRSCEHHVLGCWPAAGRAPRLGVGVGRPGAGAGGEEASTHRRGRPAQSTPTLPEAKGHHAGSRMSKVDSVWEKQGGSKPSLTPKQRRGGASPGHGNHTG